MPITIQVQPSIPVITVKTTQNGPTTNVVTVSTVIPAGSGSGASRVSQLLDVDSSHLVDGSTLVYQANTNSYVVELLPAGDISGNIDGGLF